MKKSNIMKKATSVFMSAIVIGTVSSSAVVCHAEDLMCDANPVIECVKEMPGDFFKEAGKSGAEDAFLKFILGGKVKVGMILGKTLFRSSKDFYKCLNEKSAGGVWSLAKGAGKTAFDWVSSKFSK